MSEVTKINVNGIISNITSSEISVYAADNDSNFGICDEDYNILVEFKDGHIKTQNFDSRNIDISTNDNILSGKTFSVFGDSISTYKGVSPDNYSPYYPVGDVNSQYKTYWGLLIENDGMVLSVNNSYGGSSIAWPDSDNTLVSLTDERRWSNLGEPDIIIIFCGTNDFGIQHNPLGSYVYGEPFTDMTQFSVAYPYLLKMLKQTYTASIIICCTIPTRTSRIEAGTYPIRQISVRSDAADQTCHFMYEFNDKIIETANINECYVCDFSKLFNFYDCAKYFADGVLHPNAAGHKLMYKKLKETITNILNTK